MAATIPRGLKCLISLIHIFYLFIILPLDLRSFHLGELTTFFLVWLANFKLLLFAFDAGPLYLSSAPTNTFPFHRHSFAFPSKSDRTHLQLQKTPTTVVVLPRSSVLFAVKALRLAIIIRIMYQSQPVSTPTCYIRISFMLFLRVPWSRNSSSHACDPCSSYLWVRTRTTVQ